MNYKEKLYSKYITTHTAKRKGELDYAGLKLQAHAFRQHFGRFLPSIKTAKIADLGCGSGALVWWCLKEGFNNVSGVDGSVQQVAKAHEMGIREVIHCDVFDFIKQEQHYDVLFARDLIEHFDNQTVFDFLEKCFSSLAPGGRLVLQVPNAESPYFGRVRYGDFTHELAFSPSSISQLLGAVGFTEIEVYPWRPAITGSKSLIRYIAWRLIEPFLKLPIQIESGGWSRIVTMNLIAVARMPDCKSPEDEFLRATASRRKQ